MTDKIQSKKIKTKSRVNPVVAAVTGVIVGAGIAVAGAVAFNDQKNRNKVKKVLTAVDKKLALGKDKVIKAVT
jgi:hypothetical protein